MGSWKGRGNQYIQLVRVLYCKLPTNGKQLPAFPLEAVPGIKPRSQEVGGESVTTLPPWPLNKILKLIIIITRLGQLGANISPDRSSLTPQVLIGNFLKHNYPLLYELQHINLLCLYLPKEDGVSPDAEYIPQIIFSIFLQ